MRTIPYDVQGDSHYLRVTKPRAIIGFRQHHCLKTTDTLHQLCPIELSVAKEVFCYLCCPIQQLLAACGYRTHEMFIHSVQLSVTRELNFQYCLI